MLTKTKNYYGRSKMNRSIAIMVKDKLIKIPSRFKKMNWVFLVILFCGFFSIFSNSLQGENPTTGRISGVLVDAETGDPLIGANVYLENTMIGAGTDLDGSYVILDIPEGTYTLIVSMLSYSETKVTDVEVKANETTQINLSIKPESLTGETVTVEARVVENTEALLLKKRQLSNSVSDAISAESISQSGSGNAAEAMTQVTGASVVDGKYVYIRGLGERYSSTMLNGAELPSADPEKKAVQMDLFPSNLLDNIVTLKTFTPDKPGNFSGGMVDVNTKSYPEKFTLKFSTGTSYNTQTTLKSNYLSYSGGSGDWLGMDDGTRDVPNAINSPKNIPTLSEARSNPDMARKLDQASKSFSSVMAPGISRAPINQSYSFSMGNQASLFGRPLGYIVSLSYKRDYSSYENGKSERWQLPSNVVETDSLNPKIQLNDSKGTDEVNWGGLVSVNSKLNQNHEISGNIFYTQSGESSSRYLVGRWPEQFYNADAYFETRVLKYVERNLQSYQLSGEHYFESLMGMKLDWKGAFTKTTQDEPDTRYFSDHFSNRIVQGRDTTLYSVAPSNYSQPARYFRSLDEKGSNFSMNMAFPFNQWNGISGKLKFGGLYSRKDRGFEEVRFQYNRPSNFRYDGNAEDFFSQENTGIIGYDNNNNPIWGNYIELAPDPRGGNYNGDEEITAAYTMIELPMTRNLRFVGGARFEATRMEVSSEDETKPDSLRRGLLDNNDWLPSLNLIYQFGTNMNVRGGYGRTLARPTMREKAPYVNFEFVNDYSFAGNVNLERTLIDNFDLRWEWFLQPGEIVAISGFYKKFKNPIERTIVGASSADNPEITYQNVDEGTVLGLEIEARKKLDFIHSFLNNFQFGFNLSLVNSVVDIPKEKLRQFLLVDPNREVFKDDTRPLQGQSPYLLNLDFGYSNYKSGTSANVHYNVFGKRLAEVTSDATPDVYEQPLSLLNFILSQKLVKGLSFKFSAKNILDSKIRFVHEYKGSEYVRQEHELGRSFSLGLSYDIE